jgi:hypothetical protein
MQGGDINCNKTGGSSLRTIKPVKYFTVGRFKYYEISIWNDCSHSKGRLYPLKKGAQKIVK